MIGFCSSAVLLVAEQAGSGSRAAAHLINAELTGHAAAAAAADSQLPAAPAATGKKKPSAVSQHHIKEVFEFLM